MTTKNNIRKNLNQIQLTQGVQARSKKKFKNTTNSNHRHPVFENELNREFSVKQKDQVYVTDITTCIWTLEGWLYLAVVIDLYSRKVVGWGMSRRDNC